MLAHYLQSALRNLWRVRVVTLVNLLCLIVGVACMVLTYAVVNYFENSDGSFAAAGRIRVVTSERLGNPDTAFRDMPYTGPAVASFLRMDFPQLDAVARYTDESNVAVSSGAQSVFAMLSYADPEFLEVFDFKFLSGSAKEALSRPRSAIVTDAAAERIFGSKAVVGRRLRLANREDVTVVAVIAALEKPTRLRFDVLASMDTSEAMRTSEGLPSALDTADFSNWNWRRLRTVTFVVLPQDGNLTPSAFTAALKDFAAKRVPELPDDPGLSFSSTPLGTITLRTYNSSLQTFARTSLSLTAIGYGLASLVLLIACVNYANLATALAANRAKEIGLRKALGAARSRIVIQQLVETALLAAIATLLVVLLVTLLLPVLDGLGLSGVGKVLARTEFWFFLIALISGVTAVGGLYPALVFSMIAPAEALRTSARMSGARRVPGILTVLQFAASSFLLATALVAYMQNAAVHATGMSFADNPPVVIGTSLATAGVGFETLRSRLLDSPAIQSVTASQAFPMSMHGTGPTIVSSSAERTSRRAAVTAQIVTYDFLRTLDIRLLAGRDFARDRNDRIYSPEDGDQGAPTPIIIDETLAARLGWDARDAVGRAVYLPVNVYARPTDLVRPFEIIGVAERRPLNLIGAMGADSSIYLLAPSQVEYAAIRIAPDTLLPALRHIDGTWKELSPNVPMRRQFVDEVFNQTYKILFTITASITVLALLGLLVAAMGLFAMALHLIERRMHEIGVRKTLGARTRQIVFMLMRDFAKPVVIANLLALPLAVMALRLYLNVFQDRIELTPAPFIASFVVTVLIAWVAISSRLYRAAKVGPATVLRYE